MEENHQPSNPDSGSKGGSSGRAHEIDKRYHEEVHGSMAKAEPEPVKLEPNETLLTPIRVGKNRRAIIFCILLVLVGFSITFALVNQPRVTTNNPLVEPLPRPEWWQVLIGAILGLVFGVFLAVYIVRFVNFDVVTSL